MNNVVPNLSMNYPKTKSFINGEIFVGDELDTAWEAFDKAYELSFIRPCLMLLTGLPGVGKSRLMNRYVTVKNDRASKEQTFGIALHIELNTPTTPVALLRQLIEGTGVTVSEKMGGSRATKETLHTALVNLIKEHNIRMLFIDEVQTVLPQRRNKRAQDIADTLKRLLDETQIALILAGTEDATNLLYLDYDPNKLNGVSLNTPATTTPKPFNGTKQLGKENQLGSRLQQHIQLHNFKPDEEWLMLLDFLVNAIRVETDVILNNEEMAARLFMATSGNFRQLFKAISAAHLQAERMNKSITLEMLAEEFPSPSDFHPLLMPFVNVVNSLPPSQELIGLEKEHG